MAGPFTTLAAAMRRRGRTTPGPPRRPLAPMVREEAAHALRRVVRPTTLVAALVAGLSVYVVLGPTTPGPVLATAWRPLLATVLALVAAIFAHMLLGRGSARGSRPAATAAIAAIALVVAGTVVMATLLNLLTSTFSDTAAPVALNAGLPVDPFIAVGGVLVAVALAATAIGRRLGLPTSLLFLGIGVLAGPEGLGWITINASTMRNAAIIALVVMLFHGGVTTTPADLRLAAAPGAVLATIGVMATAALTAGIVVLVVPQATARTAWLVGAVVASTDAAALGNLLRGITLPHRIHALLTVESGGNAPIAVMLTVGILASWDAPVAAGDWLSFALWQLVGGLACGVIVGAIGSRVMDRLQLPGSTLYPLLGLALAGAAYGIAAVLGASGLLATSTAGVAVAASTPRHRRAMQHVTDGVSSAVEVGLFMLLGLQVDLSGLAEVAVPGLVIALGLIVVVRPIAVAVSLAPFRLPWPDVGVLGWLGIRGAVPIVLATYAAAAGVDGADTLLNLMFFVVATSLLLHGATARRVVDMTRLVTAADGTPAQVEFLVEDLGGADLFEATVTTSSPLGGVRLADRPPDRGVRVLLVTRNDTTFAPDGDTVLRPGDRLVVSATDRDTGMAKVERWLGSNVGPGTHA